MILLNINVFESQISRRAGARARSLGSKKATNFDSGRSAGRTAPGQTDGREGERGGEGSHGGGGCGLALAAIA